MADSCVDEDRWMISILDPRALIAAIALCAASVGIGYWRGNVAGKASVQAAWNQERAEQAAIVAQAASADATAGQQASNSYQGVISHEKERIRVVRETVTRTVTGPCLGPDSVRIVNQAIGGISAASAAS